MKILLLDIERAPVLATIWSLFDLRVSTDQIIGDSYVLTWAAKWVGQKAIMDGSLLRDGNRGMLKAVRALIDEADAVVTWNGNNFDLKVLHKEFLLLGLKPPAPIKSIDLLPISRGKFYFTSHKMDYVAQQLGVGRKLPHEGHQMWLDCMERKPEAFEKMLRYNRHDVVLLAGIYEKFLPWIPHHPNHSLYNDRKCCPNCGSENFVRNGFYYSTVTKCPKYICRACGKYFRGTRAEKPTGERVVGI